MPGYRAKFIGGLGVKPDTKITLTLCVSMNCVQQTGEQFAAFLGLVIKNNRNISQLQIVVSDDLYRHYNGWISSTPDEERTAMADREYTKWIDENWRHLGFFGDVDDVLIKKGKVPVTFMTVGEANSTFGISLAELRYAKAIEFKIIRWRTLVETPEYAEARAAVDKAFVEIPAFKTVVEEVARPHCAKGHTLESVIEFLKEEIAVVAGPLRESEITYPSDSFNAAVMWALRNIFHKEVPYHGYSVELRGRQPTLDPTTMISASVASSAVDERKKAEEDGELEKNALELAGASLREMLNSRRGGRVEITVGKVAFKFAIDPGSPAPLRHVRSRSGSFFRQYCSDHSDASDAFLSIPQRSVSAPK